MPRNNPDELLRGIGRRVAELRRSRGWTQEDLADRMEVTARHIQAVEAGRENMSVRALAFFADALGVSVPELFRQPRTDASKPLSPKRQRKRLR